MSVSPTQLAHTSSPLYNDYEWRYYDSTTTHCRYGMWNIGNSAFFDIPTSLIQVGKAGQSDYNTWSDANTTANPNQVVDNNSGNVTLNYSGTSYSFVKPTVATWISSGATVTQTRTTHTGIIPSASGFTIRTPSPGAFYEKTGVGKFKIKFLDQNEPGTYLLQVNWTTLTGVINDTQTISSGSGDIELEYEGTSPSNTPVYGPITVQIDNYTITNNGIQYSPGTVFKSFTYLETGPFTASFSPDFGLPGQTISYTVSDTNAYPDTESTFSVKYGNNAIGNGTLVDTQNYTTYNTNAFVSQHGTYTITINGNVITSANYDTNYVASTTTSDEGGKRRRYPIISTNLFDRQRSIFSIGLTHKDETLF